MEIDDIKGLIELLRDTDVTEVQIEKNGTKIKIKRERLLTTIEMPKKLIHQEAASAVEAEADTQHLITVTAPLVGTFFRSSSPDSPPFVEAGARVRKGQVICIIEAMKLMNEIESEVDGVIVRALVENSQPVEYGEPLFIIEPV
ncbi:MAG: acetyl-CoA carboxylase biotin carboxyl carrier protein [Thermodesulfovibrionales bacterium]|nr:acetyl-CoA carboxylase biotin carboxyl carrier protein [Thermodesulfovibrionales bacterium]